MEQEGEEEGGGREERGEEGGREKGVGGGVEGDEGEEGEEEENGEKGIFYNPSKIMKLNPILLNNSWDI